MNFPVKLEYPVFGMVTFKIEDVRKTLGFDALGADNYRESFFDLVIEAPVEKRGEAGQWTRIMSRRNIPENLLRDPPVLAYFIRGEILALMRHELDEMILVDGIRVFDPHAKEAA